MKVLWFSLSPCGSIRRDNTPRFQQGWMISLEDKVKEFNHIDLTVSYISDNDTTPFDYDGVHYSPIYRHRAKFGIFRILSRYNSFKRYDTEMLPKLISIVKEVKPDLIHIHGTEECFGLIQDFITDIPIVFSIQGLIAPIKEKFFSGISKQELLQNESLYDRIRRATYLIDYKSFCYRAKREISYLSKANYIFGRTFWDDFCTLALNTNRKYYILNEILRPTFYLTQWKGYIDTNTIKIVTTLSSGFYKGYETLLKTAAILSKHSHCRFEWHIAGYDKNNKLLKLTEKITSLKSSQYNITLHGRIDEMNLAKLLSSSDIYVHTSHIENSPNAVCEAMLVGIPIIASYAGGTASLLTHEKDGILYQDGDPYALAGAIIHIINNPQEAIVRSLSAQKRAIKRHDKNNIAKELIDGYNSIINDFQTSKINSNKYTK